MNLKKPFHYQSIIDHIKNENKEVTKTKAETKIVYQKIIQEGSKQHIIAGETQWKKHISNIVFKNI